MLCKIIILLFIISLHFIFNPVSAEANTFKPWIGIQVGELTEDLGIKYGYDSGNGGAFVHYVFSAGPAGLGGIQSGDIIIGVNGKSISSPKQLAKLISSIKAKTCIKITLIRNSGKKSFNILVINNPYGTNSSSSGSDDGNPWFGISLKNINRQLADSWGLTVTSGILVVKVYEDSPAYKGGIKKGDIIVELDGVPVKTYEELMAMVTPLKPGKTISLGIWHNQKKKKVDITF